MMVETCGICRFARSSDDGKMWCTNPQADEWYEYVTRDHICILWGDEDEANRLRRSDVQDPVLRGVE